MPDSVNIVPDTQHQPETGTPHGVGLLVKAFQILDLFTDERPYWTQAELARALGLARSTLSRLVRFLCGRGFLFERRGRYSLGFAAIDLGRRAQMQINLVDLCFDLLEELAQASAETVHLAAYDETRSSVVCLAQLPSRQGGLRVFEYVGAAYPLHSGATSKVVLAFLAERQVNAVLSSDLTPLNPAFRTTPEAIREHLAAIRETGYAITREETYPGVVGIAVPILTLRRQPLGAIALAGPIHRMGPEAIEEHLRRIIDIGKRASERISGAAGR